MKKKIEAIWDDVLLKLEQEHDISSAAINAWIKPLNIKEVKDDQIVLSLNSNFDARGIHFIESKMYDFYISLAIQDITGKVSSSEQTIKWLMPPALPWQKLRRKLIIRFFYTAAPDWEKPI